MQIILLTKGRKKTVNLSSPQIKKVALISFFCLTIAATLLTTFLPSETEDSSSAEMLLTELSLQRNILSRMQEKNQNTLDSVAIRVGQMQAQLTRLNALGVHLTKKSKLSQTEFNFNEPVALGGISLSKQTESFSSVELLQNIEMLDRELAFRGKQLSLLEGFLSSKDLAQQIRPAGLPVEKGWLSSYFGYRADPFTGKRAFHHGVDIAGKEGTNVLATASGLVVWSGKRSGYGQLVEIDHGDGYITRYGHNKEILVNKGDTVKQNTIIAKMGSTGRSTGPHVHFEVLRHGKKVNPRKYLYSARYIN